MRLPLQILPALLLPATASAQLPRPSVQVSPEGVDVLGMAAASGDDVSALVWRAPGDDDRIELSVSDGRGLSWSDPIRVNDEVPPPATSGPVVHSREGVVVFDGLVYVLWTDRSTDDPLTTTIVERNAFVNVYDPATGTFQGETVVPQNDRGTAFAVRLGVSRAGGETLVWVAQIVQSDGVTPAHLEVAVSRDGGQSFPVVTTIVGPETPQHVPALDLVVQGDVADLVWLDDRENLLSVYDLYHARSTDGGVTFSPETALNASAPHGNVDPWPHGPRIVRRRNLVAVAWTQNDAGSNETRVRVATGGVFGADHRVDTGSPSVTETADAQVAVTARGEVVVAWSQFDTTTTVHARSSPDGGASWGSSILLSPGGGFDPALVAVDTPSGHPGVAAAFRGFSASGNELVSVYSHDGGITWEPPFTASDGPPIPEFDLVSDGTYRNFLLGWRTVLPDGIRAGGYRPQTLQLVGWEPGATEHGFWMDHLDTASDLFAVGLFSLSPPASFLLPDGRELGIAPDAASLSLALQSFVTPVIADTAVTPVLVAPGMAGLQVWLVGLGFGGVPFHGSITDVRAVTM